MTLAATTQPCPLKAGNGCRRNPGIFLESRGKHYSEMLTRRDYQAFTSVTCFLLFFELQGH